MVLLLSWNVAGLSTTVQRVHSLYGNQKEKNKNNSKNDGTASTMKKSIKVGNNSNRKDVLKGFFDRHQADIVCLQEHKIPLAQLSSRAEPHGCSVVDGYESFWSCCVDANRKGLNGVVTYARKGMVQSADPNVLMSLSKKEMNDDDPNQAKRGHNGVKTKDGQEEEQEEEDLNKQGRCLLTDHGDFVVFNVYAPCSGGHSTRSKMRFLNALRRAMQRQRNQGKAVVLVGDLNISDGPLDVFWKDRAVHVSDILQRKDQCNNDGCDANANVDTNTVDENRSGNEGGDNPQPQHQPRHLRDWKEDVRKTWPRIVAALETKEAMSTRTTNTLTGEQFDKFRLVVQVDGCNVHLGKHESSEGHCLWPYNLDEQTYVCPETEQTRVSVEANVVSVRTLTELVHKIGGIEWNEHTIRSVAEEATTSRASPSRQWLKALFEEDNMVDVFRYCYPTAQARYGQTMDDASLVFCAFNWKWF